MRKRAVLIRLFDDGTRTLSRQILFSGLKPIHSCVILEPPWKENQPNISCIPAGKYKVVPCGPTENFKYPHFQIPNVPGRKDVAIHRGNYPYDTEGCQCPGVDFDKKNNVTDSKSALSALVRAAPDGYDLEIIDVR